MRNGTRPTQARTPSCSGGNDKAKMIAVDTERRTKKRFWESNLNNDFTID